MKTFSILFLSLILCAATFSQTKMYINKTVGTDSIALSDIKSITFKTFGLPPTNGLVAYYPFIGNANDASGNGNNGTVNGATLTTDRFGSANKAYNFDGSSSYVQVADNPMLDLTGDFSLSLWEYSDQLGPTFSRVILSKHPYGIIDGYWLARHPTGQLDFEADPYFDGTTPRTDSSRIHAQQWQHVVFTYNKTSQV